MPNYLLIDDETVLDFSRNERAESWNLFQNNSEWSIPSYVSIQSAVR